MPLIFPSLCCICGIISFVFCLFTLPSAPWIGHCRCSGGGITGRHQPGRSAERPQCVFPPPCTRRSPQMALRYNCTTAILIFCRQTFRSAMFSMDRNDHTHKPLFKQAGRHQFRAPCLVHMQSQWFTCKTPMSGTSPSGPSWPITSVHLIQFQERPAFLKYSFLCRLIFF